MAHYADKRPRVGAIGLREGSISWGTLPVIASIEIYLNRRIWGREHLSQARKQEPN